MTFHLNLPYLNYILDIVKDIEESIDKASKDMFMKNKDLRDANIRRIYFITKSINNLPVTIKNRFNPTDLRKFSRMYEDISNQYCGIDSNLIWNLLKRDLPNLKEQILNIKKDIKKKS